ncbi:MAG: 3-deoxy-manno-octulosonate cytidylyltransferase [Acidobacteriia bacterium]|nr:3-deoxy-manno-octulosonate cytidylyltransferase [Terriglobia bacterium]
MKPQVLAVIPARYASTRFPGKVLTPIDNHPMLEWVFRRVSQAQRITSICIATDDRRVEAAASAFGAQTLMTSRRHHSGTDRIAEVARQVSFPVLVNVQGDEPLIEPRAIDDLVAGFLRARRRFLAGTLKSPIRRLSEVRDPNVVKVVTNARGEALYFSRSPIPHVRGLDLRGLDFLRQNIFFKHLGIYIYTREFLLEWPRLKPSKVELLEALEQLRVLENGYKMQVLETSFSSPSVDTPRDVSFVEREIVRRKIEF